jgi:hypothetical protein
VIGLLNHHVLVTGNTSQVRNPGATHMENAADLIRSRLLR